MAPGHASGSKPGERTALNQEREIKARKPYWQALNPNHGSRFLEDGLNEIPHYGDQRRGGSAHRSDRPTGAGVHEPEHTSTHDNPTSKHGRSAPKQATNPAPKYTSPVPKIQVVKYSDYNSWSPTPDSRKQGEPAHHEPLDRRDRGKDPVSKPIPKHDDGAHRHARRATVDQPVSPIKAEHLDRHARAESSTHHRHEEPRRRRATTVPVAEQQPEARKPNKLRKPPPSPGFKR